MKTIQERIAEASHDCLASLAFEAARIGQEGRLVAGQLERIRRLTARMHTLTYNPSSLIIDPADRAALETRP